MFQLLFLLFLIIPVIEIYLLIQVGGIIGTLPTVGLVVFTAVLGAFLVRQQGLATLLRVQQSMARGELPTTAMFEGVILLLAGALLLTPGFFTDTLGFLALVPPLRRAFVLYMLQRGMVHVMHGHPSQPQHHQQGPRTIEGEYRREDD